MGKNRHRNISNIVLVGMPGVGKSTIGVILAKNLGMGFVDSDILIQQEDKRTLQKIIDVSGYLALRGIEEKILLQLECSRHVIATGGSAVYSSRAMDHLGASGMIVFLHLDFGEIQRRIRNFHVRGIARRPDQSFYDLFCERSDLYARYADTTVDCRKRTIEEICEIISQEFRIFREG
jgi:shikimate kinase